MENNNIIINGIPLSTIVQEYEARQRQLEYLRAYAKARYAERKGEIQTANRERYRQRAGIVTDESGNVIKSKRGRPLGSTAQA
jgi:hypothetical protein